MLPQFINNFVYVHVFDFKWFNSQKAKGKCLSCTISILYTCQNYSLVQDLSPIRRKTVKHKPLGKSMYFLRVLIKRAQRVLIKNRGHNFG
jgi:hypothetical protein